MNSNLLFDFSVDKENKTIAVKREFAANADLVWAAWTTPELLDLWWAPKPYHTKTKSMDFREGGFWLYGMYAPDNAVHWCRADYKKIDLLKSYTAVDTFCDEDGNNSQNFPNSEWTNTFIQNSDGTTTVDISIKYKRLEDLENVIQMGFKEGFSAAMGNLDQYVEAQFRLRTGLRTDNSPRVCSYLNFPGNTEEAFLFYRSVFKTEFNGGIQRFGDLPPDSNHPPVADSVKKMILHIELPILGNHILKGTDAPKEMGFELVTGNNMNISLEPETREEATRIFEELSVNGTITMPLQDMFFGAYFGMFTDQYGINWMVNYKN